MGEIYWERQVGDNCRIHSLNAFFGEGKISVELFTKYCKEYDSIVPGLESIKMDGFSECRSIVSFVVDKISNKFLLLVPINLRNVHKQNRGFWNYDRFTGLLGKPDGILNYFEFNKGHIWLNKYKDGDWFKLDSLSGVTKINKLRKFGENGFLLVFEKELIYKEISYLIDVVKSETKLEELDIAFNNLFHLIKQIKLEYDETDAEFNNKLSNLKIIGKLLQKFINLNRTGNEGEAKKIKLELKSIIDSSIF